MTALSASATPSVRAIAYGGSLRPPMPATRPVRRDVSPTIVYSLIMATTLVSFWDLYLLGTHVHG